MRGAVAALAGALLFFLGVLTGGREGDRLSPPPAIHLGEEPAAPAAGDGGSTGPGAPPPAGPPAANPPADPPPVTPPAEAPPESGQAGGGSGAGGGDGGVERVESRVECVDVGGAGRAGDAGRGGCPPGLERRPAEPPGSRKGAGDGQR